MRSFDYILSKLTKKADKAIEVPPVPGPREPAQEVRRLIPQLIEALKYSRYVYSDDEMISWFAAIDSDPTRINAADFKTLLIENNLNGVLKEFEKWFYTKNIGSTLGGQKLLDKAAEEALEKVKNDLVNFFTSSPSVRYGSIWDIVKSNKVTNEFTTWISEIILPYYKKISENVRAISEEIRSISDVESHGRYLSYINVEKLGGPDEIDTSAPEAQKAVDDYYKEIEIRDRGLSELNNIGNFDFFSSNPDAFREQFSNAINNYKLKSTLVHQISNIQSNADIIVSQAMHIIDNEVDMAQQAWAEIIQRKRRLKKGNMDEQVTSSFKQVFAGEEESARDAYNKITAWVSRGGNPIDFDLEFEKVTNSKQLSYDLHQGLLSAINKKDQSISERASDVYSKFTAHLYNLIKGIGEAESQIGVLFGDSAGAQVSPEIKYKVIDFIKKSKLPGFGKMFTANDVKELCNGLIHAGAIKTIAKIRDILTNAGYSDLASVAGSAYLSAKKYVDSSYTLYSQIRTAIANDSMGDIEQAYLLLLKYNDQRFIKAADAEIVKKYGKNFLDSIRRNFKFKLDKEPEDAASKQSPMHGDVFSKGLTPETKKIVNQLRDALKKRDHDKVKEIYLKLKNGEYESGGEHPGHIVLTEDALSNIEALIMSYDESENNRDMSRIIWESDPTGSLVEKYYRKDDESDKKSIEEKKIREELHQSPFLLLESRVDAERIMASIIDSVLNFDDKNVTSKHAKVLVSILKKLSESYVAIVYKIKMLQAALNSYLNKLAAPTRLAKNIESVISSLAASRMYTGDRFQSIIDELLSIRILAWDEISSIRTSDYSNLVARIRAVFGREPSETDIKFMAHVVKTILHHKIGPNVEKIYPVLNSIQDKLIMEFQQSEDKFKNRKNQLDRLTLAGLRSIKSEIEELMLLSVEKGKKMGVMDLDKYLNIKDLAEQEESDVLTESRLGEMWAIGKKVTSGAIGAKEYIRSLKRGGFGKKFVQDVGMMLFAQESAVADPEVQESQQVQEPISNAQLDDLMASIEAIEKYDFEEHVMEESAKYINSLADLSQEMVDELKSSVEKYNSDMKENVEKLDEEIKPLMDLEAQASINNGLQVEAVVSPGHYHGRGKDVERYHAPAREFMEKRLEPLPGKETPRYREELLTRGKEIFKHTETILGMLGKWIGPGKDISVMMDSWLKKVGDLFGTPELYQTIKEHYNAKEIIYKFINAVAEKCRRHKANNDATWSILEAAQFKYKQNERKLTDADMAGRYDFLHEEGDLYKAFMDLLNHEALIADLSTEKGRLIVKARNVVRQSLVDIAGVQRGELVVEMAPPSRFPNKIIDDMGVLEEKTREYLEDLINAKNDPSTTDAEAKVLDLVANGVSVLIEVVKAYQKYMPAQSMDAIIKVNRIIDIYKHNIQEGRISRPEILVTIFRSMVSRMPPGDERNRLFALIDSKLKTSASNINGIQVTAEDSAYAGSPLFVILDSISQVSDLMDEIELNEEKMPELVNKASEFVDGLDAALSNVAKEERPLEDDSVELEPETEPEQEDSVDYSQIFSPGLAPVPAAKKDDIVREASIIPAMVPCDQYLGFDLSENVMGVEEVEGRKKIVINRDLKNLVSKRMNEVIRGSHRPGDVVNVDMDDFIASGTVVAYLGEGMYKVSLNGNENIVPMNKIFRM